MIAMIIVVPVYLLHYHYYVERKIEAHGIGAPENYLKVGLVPCFLLPVGMFIFGEYKLQKCTGGCSDES
jgi:hypothetical protein